MDIWINTPPPYLRSSYGSGITAQQVRKTIYAFQVNCWVYHILIIEQKQFIFKSNKWA